MISKNKLKTKKQLFSSTSLSQYSGHKHCCGNIIKNKIFQPTNPLHKSRRERKHFYCEIGIKIECDAITGNSLRLQSQKAHRCL
jgi:hypothetical protein